MGTIIFQKLYALLRVCARTHECAYGHTYLQFLNSRFTYFIKFPEIHGGGRSEEALIYKQFRDPGLEKGMVSMWLSFYNIHS